MNRPKKLLIGSMTVAVGAAGFMAATTANAEPVPHSPEANKASFWEDYFDVDDIECEKIETTATPYTVPAEESGYDWYAVIIKSGAGDGANEVFRNPAVGAALSHPSGKDTSHVIICQVPETDDETTPPPSETTTPPPSETTTPPPSETTTPPPSETTTPPPSQPGTPTHSESVKPTPTHKPKPSTAPTVPNRPMPPKTGN